MAISNISSTSSASSINASLSPLAAPLVNKANSISDQQTSAIVSISSQAQQLNAADNKTASSISPANSRTDTAMTEKVETRPKESAETSVNQLRENETRTSSINTYA